MGRKHCGKRRNCLLQAISPFPTVISKGLFPRGVKRCRCEGMVEHILLTPIPSNCTSSFQMLTSINPFQNKPLFTCVCSENTVGKAEIACNEQFSFSRSVFYPFDNFLTFSSFLIFLSANSISMEESKLCCFGKG